MSGVAIKKRAISPAQKILRRQQILAAAAHMFATMPYEAVSLRDIAAHAGITKPALYRYFRGKEALFLALFVEELAKLVADFQAARRPVAVGVAVARLFVHRPLYCQLSAILHTVLERDLTYDEALAFKTEAMAMVLQLGGILADWLGAGTEAMPTLMMQMQQALIGVWHTSHPTGAVKQVLDTVPELGLVCHDFEPSLAAHLTALVGR